MAEETPEEVVQICADKLQELGRGDLAGFLRNLVRPVELRWFTSSYRESGYTGLYPAGVVFCVTVSGGGELEEIVDKGLERLQQDARDQGVTHVFNLRILPTLDPSMESTSYWDVLITGDGYV